MHQNEHQQSRSSPSALLKVTDAARDLSVSERSLWRLISAGKLATVRIGRSVRVTRASIDAFIASGGDAK